MVKCLRWDVDHVRLFAKAAGVPAQNRRGAIFVDLNLGIVNMNCPQCQAEIQKETACCPQCGETISARLLPLYSIPCDEEGSWQQDELLKSMREKSPVIILGEPGAGKTVALERLASEIAADGGPEVPVLVKLRAYRGDLRTLFRTALGEPEGMKLADPADLDVFLNAARCWWMFDGLDEAPGHLRAQLVGKLADFIRSNPDHRYVITSRLQDSFWPKLRESLGVKVAVAAVQPITDGQARDYLMAWLGSERGSALYEQLDGQMRGAARRPLLLRMIKEAELAGERMPGTRGELLVGFVERMMRREGKPDERGTGIPITIERDGLVALAWQMQQEWVLEYDVAPAAEAIDRRFRGNPPGKNIIDQARISGLLCGDDTIRFSHQVVQEHFASLELGQRIEKELARGTAMGLTRRILGSEVLVSLPQQGGWAECFVQLAGLTTRCDQLTREIARSNPWLAYGCLIEGREVSAATYRAVEGAIVAALQDISAQKRKQAVQQMSRIDNPCVDRYLVQAGADKNFDVRRLALRILAQRWDLADLACLCDQNAEVRWRAAARLGERGDARVAGWLIDALRDEDSVVRWAAAKALTKMDDVRAVEPLIRALRDTDRPVRLAATEALGKMGDVRATEPLLEMLQDKSGDLRSAAAQALGEIGDVRAVEPLIGTLRDEDHLVRSEAEVALAKIGGLAVEPLIGALRHEDSHLRSSAEKTLGQIGESAVDQLGAALDDEDWQVRVAAVQALEQIGDAQAVELLIMALRDVDSGVRSVAVVALQRIGDARAVDPLIETLHDNSEFMRVGAALALGKIGDARAVDPLIEALRDPIWLVRRSAAEALGRIGDAQGVGPLIEALWDEDMQVRSAVVAALGRVGHTQAVEPLIDMVRDGDYVGQRSAVEALRAIGTEPALQAVKHYEMGQKPLQSID